MECKTCGKEIKGNGSLVVHQTTCEYVYNVKEEIKKLYVDELWSIKRIKDKYNLGSQTITDILGDNLRTASESNKIARKLFPESFIHSDETKQKIREKRIKFMKENPEQTAWRTKNLSYPEKLFLEKVYDLCLDKKYSIVREYSVFPFFIDFAFVNEKVAVEIDGSQHLLPERKERDDKKDELLKEDGWFILRVSENEVKTNINSVFNTIISIINDRPKIQSMKLGVVKFPKKRQMKERESCGLTKGEIERSIKQRRVTRPPYQELINLIKTNGYSKTGKMFGVSDNSIRKWIKSYEKDL
jgi:very-short-patch-repair endonuclease